MQVFVTIRLYGYWDTNRINKGERGEMIKKMLLKINMLIESLKGGIIPCHDTRGN